MKKVLTILMLLAVVLSFTWCQSKTKKTLYVFNWTDYIEPKLIRQFERQNNCKVVYDTYNSNENMLTKMKTSNVAYDIIVPSGDHMSILIEQELLEPIDKSLLTNYHHLDPMILKKVFDYENARDYGVPYFWGTCGLIYNKKYLSEEEMEDVSWDILADERFMGKGVVTLLDDIREVLGIALIFNGYDPNDSSREALSKARATLLSWNKNIAQFDSDSFKNEIQDGTIWLGQAYNGDALQVMEENDDIDFVLPREGSTLWIDFLAIPKNSENKDLAHKFIDFMLSEKVALRNAEYVQYATPNISAFENLPKEVKENKKIYPTEEYLEKCFLIKNIGNEILKLDEIWKTLRYNL